MKKLSIALATVATGLSVFAADPVDEASAIQLKPTKTLQSVPVRLYPDGTNENHICYFKMTLSKGKAYTIWVGDRSGAEPPTIDIYDAYPKFSTSETQEEPLANFDMVQFGEEKRWIVDGKTWGYTMDWGFVDDDFGDDDFGDDFDFGDDWVDPVIPDSWTYYIVISGKPGETCNLYYIQKNDVPVGVEQNPLVITPNEGDTVLDGLEFKSLDYFIQMSVTEGRRYYLCTGGGVEGNVHAFAGLTGGIVTNIVPWTVGAYDQGVCYIPDASGTATFKVSSESGYGSKMSLTFRVDASRTIAQHGASALAVGQQVTCQPGWMNRPDSGAYDAIIDEVLFKFDVAKNKKYVIDTTGAAANLVLKLYDSKGKVVATNLSAGRGSLDVRAVLEPTAKGTYYVGVCEDLPLFDNTVQPTYGSVNLSVREVVPDESVSVISPVLGDAAQRPEAGDVAGFGPNTLDATHWYNTFSFVGRGPVSVDDTGITYAFSTTVDPSEPVVNGLTAIVYWLSGKTKKVVATGDITPGEVFTFTADANRTYYLRISPADGQGLDCPAYRLHATGYSNVLKVGALKVVPRGAPTATWQLGQVVKGKLKYESAKFAVGDSLILPEGEYTVKYLAVKGFGTPAEQTWTIVAGMTQVAEVYYGDTYDPKDDRRSGKTGSVTHKATSWSMKNAETAKTALSRTLWKTDEADYFEISGKDGYLYDIHLDQDEGTDKDAVFTIEDANGQIVCAACTAVSQQALPAAASKKYYLRVAHKDVSNPGNTSYSLNGHYANVGAIKFSKASVSVKDTATSVKLTVNRTAKDGMVRVRYYTVAGTAKANEQFIPQEGILEWANKDSKAKTVEIKLIPKLGAWYAGGDKVFEVMLEDAHGEYPAPITTAKTTVTIKESSKATVTQASVYAKKAAKTATVKTETVPLRAGTYYGIVRTLFTSNGLPALASVTLTVSAKDAQDPSRDTISAKVALAGKTYSFKTAKGESAWDEGEPGGIFKKQLLLTQKIGTVTVSNVLSVTVHDGVAGDWTKTGREDVALKMNVPDAKGKGYQADIGYAGQICRQNAKVQGYLNEAVKFAGYYTVSLVPGDAVLTSGRAATADSGLPSGNGYLTVTVDNKGKAKVAGLLADNTKVSVSATACAIIADGGSVLGYSMLVPVYLAKSPYCFGGWLKLSARADGNRPDGKDYRIVVDMLESEFIWNNDNAALTHDGLEGWRRTVAPVGGWYDKVVNLQSYYNDWAQEFSIDTIQATGFPAEALASGYKVVTAVQPDEATVDLAGDKFATDKKKLVKRADNKKLNDWGASVNPCNVQVKLTRATGIVTGSCSVWSETGDGLAQKEVTGFKHYGVITLDRDNGSDEILPDDVASAGFLNKSISIGKRKWAFSVPFNVMGTAD